MLYLLMLMKIARPLPALGFQLILFLTPVNNSASQNCKEYVQTKPESWTVLKDDPTGRIIELVPYTCQSK